MKEAKFEFDPAWEAKVILAGLGGQGVVFATRLLANTAVTLGYRVVASETHGMSQRGGSVVSHLKIGGSEAPLIRKGTADFLLALDADEAARNLPFLRPGGIAFVNTCAALPAEIQAHIERLSFDIRTMDAHKIGLDLGTATVANVAMLGFAASHPAVNLPFQALQSTLESTSSKRLDTNLKALAAGFEVAGEAIASPQEAAN